MTTIAIPTPYLGPAGRRIGGFRSELRDVSAASAPVAIRLPMKERDQVIDFRLHDGKLWAPSLRRDYQPTMAGVGGHVIFSDVPAVQKDLHAIIDDACAFLTFSGAPLPDFKRAEVADRNDMSDEFVQSRPYASMTKMAEQFLVIDGELYRESPGPILLARETNTPAGGSSRWTPSTTEIEHPWRRVFAYSLHDKDEAMAVTGEVTYNGSTFGEPEVLADDLPIPDLTDCAIEGAALQLLGASYNEPRFRLTRRLAAAVMDLRDALTVRAPGNMLDLERSGYGMFERPYQQWKAGNAGELVDPIKRLVASSPQIRSRHGGYIRNASRRMVRYGEHLIDDEDLVAAFSPGPR